MKIKTFVLNHAQNWQENNLIARKLVIKMEVDHLRDRVTALLEALLIAKHNEPRQWKILKDAAPSDHLVTGEDQVR